MNYANFKSVIDSPKFTEFRDRMAPIQEEISRSLQRAREKVLGAMARRFLGPLCPRDPYDMATVLIARGAHLEAKDGFFRLLVGEKVMDQQPVPEFRFANDQFRATGGKLDPTKSPNPGDTQE